MSSVAKMIAAAAALAATDPPAETSWYALSAEGAGMIGYAEREVARSAQGVTITDSQEVLLRDQHGPPVRATSRTVTQADLADRVRLITTERRTGRSWSRIEARITAGQARVTRHTPAGRWSADVTLPPDVRFDGGEGLLPGWSAKATPRLQVWNFDAGDMAVERITFEPASDQALDARGLRAVVRRTYSGEQLLGVARLWLDGKGRIAAASQSMFGATVTSSAVDRATALSPHAPYRVLPAVMTKSPYVIASPQTRGHIRYSFSFKDGMAFALPATPDQRVASGPGRVVLDVCEGCGAGLPTDPQSLDEASRPAIWLQSDDPRIKAAAAGVARLKVADARKMEILAQKTRAFLPKLDFNGHYSAAETIVRRSGDCTEAADLLAALGRAAGIPTRVADGLVYSRERYHGVANVFMPHSWVLAYVDGRWRSFDAALDGFDATHIALVVGDGDARDLLAAGQLAALLRWDAISEVRRRTAT